jgi:putative chitinase
MVTAEQLQKLKINAALADVFNETFDRWGIRTARQQAAFIGQCGHECGNFTKLEEGLSYAADRLMKIWPKRFPTMEVAQKYARNPKALANYVYANRMGNRDEASGDGWRFRGSGWLQLTGHDNFYHASKACGVDFVMNPDFVRTPKYAAMTAGWFWATHNCNELAERGDNLALTKKINGGTIGLDDRIHHTNLALAQFDASVVLA